MTSQQQVCSASSENEGQVLGRRLREVRKYIGFKQQQVATHLGIPRTAISEMESGKRNVSVLELKKLARLYQYPVQYFTEDEVSDQPDVVFTEHTASLMSDTDRRALQHFAEFLQAKSRSQSMTCHG